MDTTKLFKEALHLRPQERIQLAEFLVNSLDKPDEVIEKIWAKEAEKRYSAYKAGKVKVIELSEIAERYK